MESEDMDTDMESKSLFLRPIEYFDLEKLKSKSQGYNLNSRLFVNVAKL